MFKGIFLAISLCFALYKCGFSDKKPLNIVMIMADDVGYECFSGHGSEDYKTPRLDALAEKGIRFENCYSTPLCTPSRVNLLSGKSNVFNYQNFGVYPQGEPTFANHFKEHGYATAVSGKWQLKLDDEGVTAEEAGFDEYFLWNYPGTDRSRYWEPSFIKNGELVKYDEEMYGPTLATDFLIDFMQKNKDQPFLAYYPMILPHNPFDPTPDSEFQSETDSKKNFADMVQYMDKCVGRIEDALVEMGIRDRTLIIFTGDNGTNSEITSNFLGDKIIGGKGKTLDHGSHVPLVMNLPGVIEEGLINFDLVCFSDFFATMVEAADLPEKHIKNGDGWSFWQNCIGGKANEREWIYGYYFPRPYANKFNEKYSHYEIRYTRNIRYKLYDDGQMYDIIDDIYEEKPLKITRNLRPVYQKLLSALKSYPPKGENINWDKVEGQISIEVGLDQIMKKSKKK